MKGSCTLFASVLAASTVAISSTSYSSSSAHPDLTSYSQGQGQGQCYSKSMEKLRTDNSRKQPSKSEKEKFVPRFDGLRFIETLVTAHR